MQATSGVYLPRLDHIRFLAIMMVAFWHFRSHYAAILPQQWAPQIPVFSLFDEGHSGVSLFLCLSGFLFAYLCADKVLVYGRFLKNRLLRIAPLAIFWIAVYFLANPETGSTSELVLSVLSLMNRGAVPDVGWSIIVEAQFYVLFPFLLIFVRRYGMKYLFGLILICFCVRLMHFTVKGTTQLFAYSTIFGRLDQFALGMVGGFLYAEKKDVLRRYAWLILIAGAIASIAVMHVFNLLGGFMNIGAMPSPSPVWLIQLTLEGAAYTVLILGYSLAPVQCPGWLSRPIAYLGAISYSIYWSHTTIIRALKSIPWVQQQMTTPGDFLIWFPLFMLPVIAFSVLTYHLIEKPFFALRTPYWDATIPPRECCAKVDTGFAKQHATNQKLE